MRPSTRLPKGGSGRSARAERRNVPGRVALTHIEARADRIVPSRRKNRVHRSEKGASGWPRDPIRAGPRPPVVQPAGGGSCGSRTISSVAKATSMRPTIPPTSADTSHEAVTSIQKSE